MTIWAGGNSHGEASVNMWGGGEMSRSGGGVMVTEASVTICGGGGGKWSRRGGKMVTRGMTI